MRERTKSLLTTFSVPRDQLTGSLPQDHPTSEILLIPRPRPITGLMRIDSGTKKTETMKSRELKCTWCKDSSFQLTLLESRLLSPSFITKWSLEPDILETPTRNSISLSSHQVNASKLLGTVRSSSLEDLPSLKLKIPTPFHWPPNWIKSLSPLFPTLVTPRFWSAQPFAPIWDVFQYHILVHTRDGFACVTDPSTTNSEESDKDQLKQTCHTSTTRSSAQSSVLKSNSSLTSHQSSSMCESACWDIPSPTERAVEFW